MYSRFAANILSISTLLKTHLKQIGPDVQTSGLFLCIFSDWQAQRPQSGGERGQSPDQYRLVEQVDGQGMAAQPRQGGRMGMEEPGRGRGPQPLPQKDPQEEEEPPGQQGEIMGGGKARPGQAQGKEAGGLIEPGRQGEGHRAAAQPAIGQLIEEEEKEQAGDGAGQRGQPPEGAAQEGTEQLHTADEVEDPEPIGEADLGKEGGCGSQKAAAQGQDAPAEGMAGAQAAAAGEEEKEAGKEGLEEILQQGVGIEGDGDLAIGNQVIGGMVEEHQQEAESPQLIQNHHTLGIFRGFATPFRQVSPAAARSPAALHK